VDQRLLRRRQVRQHVRREEILGIEHQDRHLRRRGEIAELAQAGGADRRDVDADRGEVMAEAGNDAGA
jgi:hypothetical protein